MTVKEYEVACEKWIVLMKSNEKQPNTISSYKNALKCFDKFMLFHGLEKLTRESVLEYKNSLILQKENGEIKTSTLNNRLTILNKFLNEHDMADCKVKLERVQRKNASNDVLTETDYKRLIRWADKLGMEREKLIMQTLSTTGCRINELQFFTVENLKKSKDSITVKNKNKERSIIIPDSTRKDLLKYAKQQGITEGIIFHARNNPNKLLDKKQIWNNLQKIAGRARVKKSKVHSHSFRKIYSKRYLESPNANILTLADLLGHSSLETTRLYTRETDKEMKQVVNELFNKYEK